MVQSESQCTLVRPGFNPHPASRQHPVLVRCSLSPKAPVCGAFWYLERNYPVGPVNAACGQPVRYTRLFFIVIANQTAEIVVVIEK